MKLEQRRSRRDDPHSTGRPSVFFSFSLPLIGLDMVSWHLYSHFVPGGLASMVFRFFRRGELFTTVNVLAIQRLFAGKHASLVTFVFLISL